MNCTFRRSLVGVLGLGLIACGGESTTGPSGNGLSVQQRTGLSTLMTNQSFVNALLASSPASAYAAAFMPLMATNIQSVGTFSVAAPAGTAGASFTMPPQGNYSAFGTQVVISVKPQIGQTIKLVWTGIIGVNNLSNPTDVITVGVIDNGATAGPLSVPSTTIGSTVGTRTATSAYIALNGTTATAYAGNSGTLAITSASFSGATNCPGLVGQAIFKACSFGTGTVSGSFDFQARLVGGATTVSVPATTVSLPSTRMTIDLDYTALGLASAFSR